MLFAQNNSVIGPSKVLKNAMLNAHIPKKKLKIENETFILLFEFLAKTTKASKRSNTPVAIIIKSIRLTH